MNTLNEFSVEHQEKISKVMMAIYCGADPKDVGCIVSKLLINEVFPRWERDVIILESFGHRESDLCIDDYHYEFSKLTADIAVCLYYKVLSNGQAKKIIVDCWDDHVGFNIIQYLCASKLLDGASDSDIHGVIREVISKNEKAVKEFRSGNLKAIGAIVGAVLKIVKADAKLVSELIKQEIEKENE